ncbi:unnamed protein product [Amoebophrya sp. A25]|nr:unnamed protein product [Amoebophrya sp. A25]|eukprot:GSA25T00006020001.1
MSNLGNVEAARYQQQARDLRKQLEEKEAEVLSLMQTLSNTQRELQDHDNRIPRSSSLVQHRSRSGSGERRLHLGPNISEQRHGSKEGLGRRDEQNQASTVMLLRDDLELSRRETADARKDLARAQEKLRLAEHRLTEESDNSRKLDADTFEKRKAIRQLETDQAAWAQERGELQERIAALNQQLADVSEKQAQSRVRERRVEERAEEDGSKLRQEVADLRETEKSLLHELEELRPEEERLRQEVESLRHEIEEMERRQVSQKKQIDAAWQRSRSLEEQLDAELSRASFLEQTIECLKQEKAVLQEEIRSLEANHLREKDAASSDLRLSKMSLRDRDRDVDDEEVKIMQSRERREMGDLAPASESKSRMNWNHDISATVRHSYSRNASPNSTSAARDGCTTTRSASSGRRGTRWTVDQYADERHGEPRGTRSNHVTPHRPASATSSSGLRRGEEFGSSSTGRLGSMSHSRRRRNSGNKFSDFEVDDGDTRGNERSVTTGNRSSPSLFSAARRGIGGDHRRRGEATRGDREAWPGAQPRHVVDHYRDDGHDHVDHDSSVDFLVTGNGSTQTSLAREQKSATSSSSKKGLNAGKLHNNHSRNPHTRQFNSSSEEDQSIFLSRRPIAATLGGPRRGASRGAPGAGGAGHSGAGHKATRRQSDPRGRNRNRPQSRSSSSDCSLERFVRESDPTFRSSKDSKKSQDTRGSTSRKRW